MSDYRNFWNYKRWMPYDKYPKHHYLVGMQKLFQNGAKDISEMVICAGFCQKYPNFRIFGPCSSDHPILW